MSVNTTSNETTHKKAVQQIRSKIKQHWSDKSVHVYSFNVPPDQLQKAHDLLDKEDLRKSMKVSYNDEHNFIVRYLPCLAHAETVVAWDFTFMTALERLIDYRLTPTSRSGCRIIGATSFEFGNKQKQPDTGVRLLESKFPSVVFEVGDLGSLGQLQTDARLWLRDMPEVQLVVLLLIDPPLAPHPTLPRVSLQLWKRFSSTAAQQQRDARMVWQADWTNYATPLYILLSDVFGQQVPAAYGNIDRFNLNTADLRDAIIDSYSLLL